MIAATVRWIHSSHALVSSSGGSTRSWHSGQSGQPMPESVARTMTPIVTSRTVVDDGGRGELLEPGHGAGPTSGRWDRTHGRSAADILRGARRGADSRSPATLCAMSRSIAASRSPCSLVARRRRLRGRDPDRRRPPRRRGVLGVGRQAERDPGHRQRRAGRRAEPVRVLVPRPQDQPARRRRPTARSRWRSSRPARPIPGTAVPATFVWAIEGIARRLRGQHDVPAAGDWKAVFVTAGAGRAAGGDRRRVRRARQGLTTVGVGAAGAGDDQPDRGRRRRRPREDLERRPSRPGASTRRPSPTRSPRTSRSCSCSRRRRSAPAPSAARRSTGSRRPPRRPPRTSRSSTSSRTSSRTPSGKLQPVLDANDQLQTGRRGRTSGASSPSRGSSRSGADGIVKGSFEGVVGDDELKAAIADDRRRVAARRRSRGCTRAVAASPGDRSSA